MSLLNSLKNTFSDMFKFFSGTIKENISKIVIIFITYAVLNFAAGEIIRTFINFANSFLYSPVLILLQLSFISVMMPLFAGKKFAKKSIIPGIKFILFSLILFGLIFLLSLPARLIADILINVVLPSSVTFLGSFNIFLFVALYGFTVSLFVIFMLFSIFDFLENKTIDQPILTSWDIFKHNKLFISIISLVTALLFVYLPVLSQGQLSFVFQMLFCVLFMVAYCVLKAKETDKSVVFLPPEPVPMKTPKIKIPV